MVADLRGEHPAGEFLMRPLPAEAEEFLLNVDRELLNQPFELQLHSKRVGVKQRAREVALLSVDDVPRLKVDRNRPAHDPFRT